MTDEAGQPAPSLPGPVLLEVAGALHRHGLVDEQTWGQVQVALEPKGERSVPLVVMADLRDVLLRHLYLDPGKYDSLDTTLRRLGALEGILRGVSHLAIRQEMDRIESLERAQKHEEAARAGRSRSTAASH